MYRCSVLAAFALALVAGPVAAEEMVVSKPFAAASLGEGPLDMVAYYDARPDGAFEVTATFAAPNTLEEPMRVVLALADGERTSFAMPGYRGQNYAIARTGDALAVSVTPIPLYALND